MSMYVRLVQKEVSKVVTQIAKMIGLSTTVHGKTIPPPLVNLDKKFSPYSITECMVPELIPVLGSQPAGDASHKPSGRLPLLSPRSAVTLATLKRTATNFAAW